MDHGHDLSQEDLENMSKEYRFWVMERRVAQDRLGEEQVGWGSGGEPRHHGHGIMDMAGQLAIRVQLLCC